MPDISVFTGPSLPPGDVRQLLPRAEVLPPVTRGDLHAARKRGADVILVIDGSFSHQLAISPREVVDVLGDGAVVLGASSMGAIRAADCWPAGMRGVGTVYRLYRQGLLSSDDAVAVAMDPDHDHSAVSVALVNVQLAVRRARGHGLIDTSTATAVEAAAGGLFFAHRTRRAILSEAGVPDRDGSIRMCCERVDVKRTDAIMAVREAGRATGGTSVDASNGATFSRPVRYPGHDPLLGCCVADAQQELLRWLFGSGRYQRYVWPLVISEPEFRSLEAADDRPAALRERLASVLGRLLRDPAELARRLSQELEFLEEFDSELMRWHAVREVAKDKVERGLQARSNVLTATREAVAVAHGLGDWRSLTSDTDEGRLFGAIPLAWIDEACTQLALARS